MNKFMFIIAAGILLLAGCGSPNDPAGGGGGGSSKPAEESGFDEGTIGSQGELTLNDSGQSLTMIYAQASMSKTFPTGTDDSGSKILTTKFWMAETETTNAVVAAVLQWAKYNGKFSTTAGDPNELAATTVKYGNQELVDLDGPYCHISYNETSGLFTVEGGYTDHPAVQISWYGAVMICNWLTEMRDGHTGNVVYGGIDQTNWTHEATTEARSNNGYRLPGEWEWEYAGRYRGNDSTSTNTVSGYSNPYYTKGNSASGATADHTNEAACQAVAVYGGSNPQPPEEAEVKSLASGANTLGLYDMSGNVWEWFFDQGGTNRGMRGGSWGTDSEPLQLGNRYYYSPSYASGYIGFRLCRTAN